MRGWPWDRWDVLDSIALGLVAWLLLGLLVAVVIGRAIRLADRRAAGRVRHAPPPGWLERSLPDRAPETTRPPAGSQGAGGSSARGQGAEGTLRDGQVTGGHLA